MSVFQNARVITSRRNISITLGIKASLKFAYKIMSNKKISNTINFTNNKQNSKYYLDINILLNLIHKMINMKLNFSKSKKYYITKQIYFYR